MTWKNKTDPALDGAITGILAYKVFTNLRRKRIAKMKAESELKAAVVESDLLKEAQIKIASLEAELKKLKGENES